MVRIEFDGYCKGCKCAELELECLETDEYPDKVNKFWTAVCVHQDICEKWDDKLSDLKTEMT